MFAVDTPKIPADRKDDKHKGQSASNATKCISVKECKMHVTLLPEGLGFFNFLASQQKVKRKIPRRSLRLERSGR
jgi:hypothetical protein